MIYCCFTLASISFLIASVVRDFGLSIGKPRALSQTSEDNTPNDLETPNITV